MSKVHIYLGGPILGCDKGEANDWRHDFSHELAKHLIRGVSPLRCEPLIGDRYTTQYADPRFGTPRAIASKNRMDVQRCDLTLVHFPYELTQRKVSLGTVGELFWANGMGKPTILVSTHPLITEHPVIDAACSWKLETLEDALDTIVGLFGVYT